MGRQAANGGGGRAGSSGGQGCGASARAAPARRASLRMPEMQACTAVLSLPLGFATELRRRFSPLRPARPLPAGVQPLEKLLRDMVSAAAAGGGRGRASCCCASLSACWQGLAAIGGVAARWGSQWLRRPPVYFSKIQRGASCRPVVGSTGSSIIGGCWHR